ncbi:MAG TPA: outer membrane protein [Bradyrhizobium sp.]|jgi:outer membrane immunogenic protein|nr:outer membrane protein [Bradyrhizobium sp.]
MKKFLLGTVALVTLGAGASAADLAPRYTKAPAMINPAYNWTGFYVGLNAGAASTDGGLAVVATDGFFESRFADRFSKTGFLGGGQIGYNYQSGMSVFGVEADAAWLNVKSSTNTTFDPFFNGKGSAAATFSSSIDWLVTARARAGIAATPALLLYVTGGLAVAGVNVRYQNNAGINGNPLLNSLSANDTKYGWTAGFGAEYALGGSWSVKAEYLRVLLGDTTLNVPFDPATGLTGSVKVSQNIDLIRAGINYKFGGPAGGRY